MDQKHDELSPETQRRVDAILADARAESELRRPETYLGLAFGVLTGVVSLIALALVWAQQPSLRSPYIFLIAGLPFLTFLALRRAAPQQGQGVFRIDMFPIWLTLEAAVGAIFFVAAVLIGLSMLLESAQPEVAELFIRIALVGGAGSIGTLFALFLMLVWKVRVVVDDSGLHEHRLLRTVGAQWFEIESIEVEPAADSLAAGLFWPTSAVYRAVIARLRRKGALKGEGWSVRRVRLRSGDSFALRVQGLMELEVAVRMTQEILRRAEAAAVPLVDRSGTPVPVN